MKVLSFILPLMAMISCFCFINVVAEVMNSQAMKKTYIVHMDKNIMPASFDDLLHWYDSSLKSASESAEMLYAYHDVVQGFSARLTPEEIEALENQPGVLSVQPEMKYELHTTRSPEFVGLAKTEALLPGPVKVSEVIIGVIDTGVWPESKSFDDKGLGPVPSSWKGKCEEGKNFKSSSCNRKLIGARYFLKGYEASIEQIDDTAESRSPRDDEGHGTHTATTAAGSAVSGASLFGYAKGVARGMATQARVAAYKVCWLYGCFSSDILAAMDAAVGDGVNVISMSMGGGLSEYHGDPVAIGAFAAMTHGILVSCSAGNGGPGSGSLSNVAPWITTVGAGTLDRNFPAYVSTGDGKNYSGVSLYSGKPLSKSKVPLVYAAEVSNSSSPLCTAGSLIPSKVTGKIVICKRGGNGREEKGFEVKKAGGVGMILIHTNADGEDLTAAAHVLPSATVGERAGKAIKAYAISNPKPVATVFSGGTKLGIKPSPLVAAFSSRGPNFLTQELLKPDIIAPGVNILAGWTGAAGPTGLPNDNRRVDFNIISGTSMSCPHVSGLAALIKAAHPDWSPAAIKSALMTTAYSTYKDGKPILDVATRRPATPFDYGAGHVNPAAALDPGLVYDANLEDYLGFLCALNYTALQIKAVTGKFMSCGAGKTYSLRDFNYPSFSVPLKTGPRRTLRYSRTLTNVNVGPPAEYKVSVSSQTPSVKISVKPATMRFSKLYEKKSYVVTFKADSMASGTTSFGLLEWSDGTHRVSSPIAFSWT